MIIGKNSIEENISAAITKLAYWKVVGVKKVTHPMTFTCCMTTFTFLASMGLGGMHPTNKRNFGGTVGDSWR